MGRVVIGHCDACLHGDPERDFEYWLAILEQNGFLNSVLYYVGLIPGPKLLLSYQSIVALFAAIIIAELWRATAIVLVILVAGMSLIPKEYYEAAEVFGASPWKRFVRKTRSG